ncbi:hypothetical protein OU994_11155 [Pseudoduganella sp. SL102]|uniref:hypothetical protein n=1 Tax=Pseudoduganella sp. SL102 TaxID=2995154 RepID=UPI00248B74F3|nr:hypothetical protein [Pseudoduganella sp. SL102]WBS04786.1 hypothetical protein OU994_11155 [Pseudoduganella sp. SL102]
MLDINRAKEAFDNFLFIMEDRLEAIEAEGEKHGISLEPTMDSLEKLELLFFKLSENITEDERNSLIVSFARYVGEIVRITYNGKWHLSLADPKNIYYNYPVLIGHTPIDGLAFSPIHTMRVVWLRKKQGLLRRIIMADIKPRDFHFEPEQ